MTVAVAVAACGISPHYVKACLWLPMAVAACGRGWLWLWLPVAMAACACGCLWLWLPVAVAACG